MPQSYFSTIPAVYPEELRCEFSRNPLGIDNAHPRFSFHLPSRDNYNWQFIAYQLQVLDEKGKIIWDHNCKDSNLTNNIAYKGKALKSFSRYHWRVRLMGEIDVWDPWSPDAYFETAMLTPERDCKAKWITTPHPIWYQAGQWESGVPQQQTDADKGKHTHGIYLGSSVTLNQSSEKVKRARAYVSGVGIYQFFINRKPVGTNVLSPSQTDYSKRVLYDVLPLEEHLKESELDTFDLTLFLGNGRHIALYGFDKPRGFIQILIDFEDGSRQWYHSDNDWSVVDGPIQQNSLFNGEFYDSNITISTHGEQKAEVVQPYPIQAATLPPITIEHTLNAQNMWETDDGYVYDFGQNFSGFVRLIAEFQPKSTRLTLSFAELINEEGKLNPASNRNAQATDTYICDGKSIDWHPVSTYHGFRYVLLTGYNGEPTLHTLTGLFVHTETPSRGTFCCSHEGLHAVHTAIQWGLRSNMMGIPTDSPQRDERHGWLGDALLAAPAAMLNYETTMFYEKFLQDIVDTQREDGAITDVAPKFWMDKPADPAWGSAFISIAWYLYLYNGDSQVLHRFFPQMCKYIDFLISQTEDGIITELGTFGDWCAPGLVTSKKTGLPFISTWYLYHDLDLMSKIAEVVGDEDERERFEENIIVIVEALRENYWTGSYIESLPMTPWDFPDQTSQAMTLAADILDIEDAASLADYLNKLVSDTSGDHVGTGIHGTKYLLEQLTRWGYQEKAYTIATQQSYPGWLYMLREGATTLWERWEYITCGGMNSHNHIMLGSIDQWFYEQVAGIMPLAAGWSVIGFAPARFSKLSFASASVITPHGKAAIHWERSGTKVTVILTVPQGCTGLLFLPGMYMDQRWDELSVDASVSTKMAQHPQQPYPLDTISYDELSSGTYKTSWDETTRFEIKHKKGR